jgi:hypothetical protein
MQYIASEQFYEIHIDLYAKRKQVQRNDAFRGFHKKRNRNPDFLKQLGFQLRPTISRDCDNLNELADVLELDLRENKFGNWIMSFFKDEPKQIQPISARVLSEKEVRKLFLSLNSPAKLQTFAPYFSNEASGIELQKMVLAMLTSEKSGLSKRDRGILYTTYYTFDNNRIAAMQACNMSRATFYRHLNKALSNFTELLKGNKRIENT